MPDSSFTRFYNKLINNGSKKIELQDILEIEQYFRVSRNAVLVRLIQEEYITVEESVQYKKDILKNAKKYGFDITLYLPTTSDEPKTYGSYLKKALELKDSGLISDGKYEEYLLEAYRSDIVFDEKTIDFTETDYAFEFFDSSLTTLDFPVAANGLESFLGWKG